MEQNDLVVIGTSLGGLEALGVLLSGLPPDFRVPVAIVQHRTRDTDGLLLTSLQRFSVLPMTEAVDKEPVEAGRIYLAPADYHLMLEPGNFALSTDAPVNYSRPSIDVLFETAAFAYGSSVVGLVLTGANRDGANGVRAIKKRGGRVIVQHPAGAQAPVMPKAAMTAVTPDWVLPLSEIASHLIGLFKVSNVG